MASAAARQAASGFMRSEDDTFMGVPATSCGGGEEDAARGRCVKYFRERPEQFKRFSLPDLGHDRFLSRQRGPRSLAGRLPASSVGKSAHEPAKLEP